MYHNFLPTNLSSPNPFSYSLTIQKIFIYYKHTNLNSSASLAAPISCTTAKNCWWPSCFSCFSSTKMKYFSKQHCIITQSTAPGRLMSVARNTMSSPTKVVMVLWAERRCSKTRSRSPPCHVQVVPGHGQEYGRKGHCSSC